MPSNSSLKNKQECQIKFSREAFVKVYLTLKLSNSDRKKIKKCVTIYKHVLGKENLSLTKGKKEKKKKLLSHQSQAHEF